MQNIFTILTQSLLIKNLCIYSAGSLLLRIISVCSLPFTMHLISPTDYGLLSLLYSFISIVVIGTGFGLRQVLFIEFFHHSIVEQKKMINTIIGMYLLLAIPIFLYALYNYTTINVYLFTNNANIYLILLSLVICFCYFFSELLYQVLTLQGNMSLLIRVQLLVAIITTASSISFLYLGWGIIGMLCAYLLGIITTCCIGFYLYIQKNCYAYACFVHICQKSILYLKLGFPFIPSMLLGWILSSANRWILAQYSSLHTVGLYALADNVGQLYVSIIIQSINNAYIPYLLKQFTQNTSIAATEQWNRKNMVYSISILCAMLGLGYCFAQPLLYWLLPLKYQEAIRYIWPILLGNIIWTASYFNLGLIFYYKKISFHAYALLIPSLLNLILNAIGIPLWGIAGSLYATIISYTCYFLLTFFYNQLLLKKSLMASTILTSTQ